MNEMLRLHSSAGNYERREDVWVAGPGPESMQ
jgi:hypothetical protein